MAKELTEEQLNIGREACMDFIRKTSKFTKAFDKLVRKQKNNPDKQKKMAIKFVKDNLDTLWQKEVVNKVWGKPLNMKKEDEAIYIFGIFVSGHSKQLQKGIVNIFKQSLKELNERGGN